MSIFNFREDFSIIKRILDKTDDVKIIGSYIYNNSFKDIDICIKDPIIGYKIKEKAKKEKIKIQLILVDSDIYNNIEDYLTFENLCFCVHFKNGEPNFIESNKFITLCKGGNEKLLKFNEQSLKLFKNVQVINFEIKKLLERGFLI